MSDSVSELDMLNKLIYPDYTSGVDASCYQCPFASEPLNRDGSTADWREISNDPTEAYFRCSLPSRDNVKVAWGEHSPCSPREWLIAIKMKLEQP